MENLVGFSVIINKEDLLEFKIDKLKYFYEPK